MTGWQVESGGLIAWDGAPATRHAVAAAGEHGIEPGIDALTVFAGEGTRCVVDQLSREPDSLARSLAASLQTLHHPKLVLGFDAILQSIHDRLGQRICSWLRLRFNETFEQRVL